MFVIWHTHILDQTLSAIDTVLCNKKSPRKGNIYIYIYIYMYMTEDEMDKDIIAVDEGSIP